MITGAHEVAAEAGANLVTRPLRQALAALTVVLGVGVLVATVSLTQSTRHQVLDRLDLLAATTVAIQGPLVDLSESATTLPWDSSDRVRNLTGVTSATLVSELASVHIVAAIPHRDAGLEARVWAGGPRLLESLGGTMLSGRMFDVGHDLRGQAVAVVGSALARRLNLDLTGSPQLIYLDEDPVLLIGILDHSERLSALTSGIIVPTGYARANLDLKKPERLVIDVAVGAADNVARVAPYALDPIHGADFVALRASDDAILRDEVASDFIGLGAAVASVAVTLSIGGIASASFFSVRERRSEIGLRRALGARRWHIATQFMAEASVVGAMGGLVGGAVGSALAVLLSINRGWTPVLDPRLVVVAAIAGWLAGVVGGFAPAAMAARISPIEALIDEA